MKIRKHHIFYVRTGPTELVLEGESNG